MCSGKIKCTPTRKDILSRIVEREEFRTHEGESQANSHGHFLKVCVCVWREFRGREGDTFSNSHDHLVVKSCRWSSKHMKEGEAKTTSHGHFVELCRVSTRFIMSTKTEGAQKRLEHTNRNISRFLYRRSDCSDFALCVEP